MVASHAWNLRGFQRAIPSTSDEESTAEAFAKVHRTHGQLDVLVNNVGASGEGDVPNNLVHATDLAAWNNTLALNLTSAFLGMKYGLRNVLKARRGSIVNVASLAGLRVTPFATMAYHASKAGVIHLTAASAVLYASHASVSTLSHPV